MVLWSVQLPFKILSLSSMHAHICKLHAIARKFTTDSYLAQNVEALRTDSVQSVLLASLEDIL